MKRRLLAAVALFVAAAVAQAQPMPPGKWWRRPEIVQQLALTGEQQERLDAIFHDAAEELIDLKAAADKAGIAVRREIDNPNLDKARVRAAAAKLNEARAKLFERELMMLVDMRTVLNPQQWSKVRQVVADRMEMRPQDDRRLPPGEGPPPRRP